MLPKHDQKLYEIKELLYDFGTDLVNATTSILDGLSTLHENEFEEAKEFLKLSNEKGKKIDKEIITSLALFGAEATDLRSLVAYLRVTNELVRVSDHIKTVSKRIAPLIHTDSFSSDLQEYSIHLCKSALDAVESCIRVFVAEDVHELEAIYQKVLVEESKADDLYAIFEKNVLVKLSTIKEFDSNYIQILSTMRKLERISDRAVNVAKLLMFAKVGGELDAY